MLLPHYVQDKVNELYLSLNKKVLVETRENLTHKYKHETGQNKSLIEKKQDSMLYAISRMPATFSVIYTLIENLSRQKLIQNVSSVIDVGSGTGAGYFAIKELDESADITLIEREQNMIDIFNQLTNNSISVIKADASSFDVKMQADLVFSSYVLSEMTPEIQKKTLDNLFKMSSGYVLLIDTGTPQTYNFMMQLKEYAIKCGWKVLAPCMQKDCPLNKKGDYCQFYARVERSSLHKLAKNATLSYEDEKYFYLLLSKTPINISGQRVIRRPVIKENNISLMLCGENGVENTVFTKRNKEQFKTAKKSKINDLI